MFALDLGEGASGHPEQVRQAVVVQVDDAVAPADIPRLDAQSRAQRDVVEEAACVPVQGHGVFREMCLKHVEPAVEVEIANGDTHASLFVAVLIHGQAGLHPLLSEGAVSAIVEQQARSRVAGDIDILPAVAVQVRRHCGETEPRRR